MLWMCSELAGMLGLLVKGPPLPKKETTQGYHLRICVGKYHTQIFIDNLLSAVYILATQLCPHIHSAKSCFHNCTRLCLACIVTTVYFNILLINLRLHFKLELAR